MMFHDWAYYLFDIYFGELPSNPIALRYPTIKHGLLEDPSLIYIYIFITIKIAVMGDLFTAMIDIV